MGQEKLGVVDETAIKAVGLFGGGIARSGSTCGALLGAVAAIAGMHGRGNLEEKEDPVMWELGDRIVRRFQELTGEFGGIRCQEIARVDWKDPQAVSEFRGPNGRRGVCIELVGEVAQALGELLDQQSSGLRSNDIQ